MRFATFTRRSWRKFVPIAICIRRKISSFANASRWLANPCTDVAVNLLASARADKLVAFPHQFPEVQGNSRAGGDQTPLARAHFFSVPSRIAASVRPDSASSLNPHPFQAILNGSKQTPHFFRETVPLWDRFLAVQAAHQGGLQSRQGGL